MECCKTMSPEEHSRQQTLLIAVDDLLASSMQLLPVPLADCLRLAVCDVSRILLEAAFRSLLAR